MSEAEYGLFERWGVEVEYVIVDAETLAVAPIADRILVDSQGQPSAEIDVGPLSWSNELVLHVLELKTNGPSESLHGLASAFQAGITDANRRLAPYGAMLMPSGMHPSMDPTSQTKLWPHDQGEVYRAFDRVFGCKGHGWANLQSVHLNLPFRGDAEFRRLHAAVRAAIPLLPALSASSPIVEGHAAPWLDTRLEVYRHNAEAVPSVSGQVVPEPVASEEEYRDHILAPIYADLEAHDPDGILREEWVNARGAIARFDRNTIEIRVLDTQECALADIAVIAAVSALVRRLADEEHAGVDTLNALDTDRLSRILLDTIKTGDATEIEDRDYLQAVGWSRGPCRARDVWDAVVESGLDDGPDREGWELALEVILSEGCLARRILTGTGDAPDKRAVDSVYRALTRCLAGGHMLRSRG